MEDNNNKISTSIQYHVSNILLFNKVFRDWPDFHEHLKSGIKNMQQYLVELWNKTRDELKNNDKLILKDLDKEVTADDFDVTLNVTKNRTVIYYITFPNYEYRDAASKYVALALTPKMPRYFTLEYSEHVTDHTPCWVVGEFVIKDSKKVHISHQTSDNMRLPWFAGYVLGLLESENL